MIVICEQITNCLHFMIFFLYFEFHIYKQTYLPLTEYKTSKYSGDFFRENRKLNHICFEGLSATALKIPQTYHKSKVVGLLDFFLFTIFFSLSLKNSELRDFFEACAISKQLLCVCLAKNSF